MMRTPKYVSILMLLAVILPMRQVFAIPEPVSDVRIVIDVSGSMKKNDPNNLRSPALRMVVGLLPESERSGVWTFAKYVNMLVPLREVNDAWRMEAEKQSEKIHSYGLFTDIEQALNTATANQKTANPRYRRSVILLSDGLVDISTDEQVSKKSRQRILDKLVPRLKKANVAVHTIALADTSDHALLRAISLATDGWYEQVDTAEQLQRVFLHMFEKSAQRDTVPLTDNHFKIDDSVSEMTLLIFRNKESKATELQLPDQSRISQQQSSNNVRWHSEAGYDLITISEPQTGAWFIDAELDPDNRVMVVTDLKLKTTDLPNNILIGETFDFDVSLTEKGEKIVRQDFLKLVNGQLKLESELDYPSEQSLNSNQYEGVYKTHVGESFQPGRNDIVVTMTSATFERQRRQSVNVVETPFEIIVDQLTDESTRTHRITLIPDAGLIKEDNIAIAAMLTAEDGSEWPYEVMKTAQQEWQLTLADLHDVEQYKVALQIRAETLKGRDLFLQPKAIILDDIRPPELEEAEQQIELEQIEDPISDEMDSSVELLPIVDDETTGLAEELADNESGLSPAIKLAIGNTIILLLVVIGIFLWRRNSALSTNPGDKL